MSEPSLRDLRIRAEQDFMCNGVKLHAYSDVRDEEKILVGRLVWEECDRCCIVPPTTRLHINAAQVLMDDLWNAGIRPTEGAGTAGAMRAAERHIEDLRAIAFKVVGVEPKAR